MPRARALAIVVLLLSYGAVSARQPAVRTSVPLGVSAAALAEAAGVSADRSRILIDLVRTTFDSPDGQDEQDLRVRSAVTALFRSPREKSDDTVPLPLDPSIWRETLLRQRVADRDIIATIFADRRTALLYHGLAALDDETLAWLGPDRETLLNLARRPAIFSAFAGSLRVHAGRIVIPGGAENDRLWHAIVGADPQEPGPFVRRLFSSDSSAVAYFYDTVAHLDPPRQRFALGATLPPGVRIDRARALLATFESEVPGWSPQARPFVRPQLDIALVLGAFRVTDEGRPIGPMTRDIWDVVFRDDIIGDVEFRTDQPRANESATPVDVAWLASRLARVQPTTARRRVDAWLFAQRVFPGAAIDEMPAVMTALRGHMAFPALMLTLERLGVRSPGIYTRAVVVAQTLNGVHPENVRRTATLEFQAAVAILERAARTGGLSRPEAAESLESLLALQVSPERGYDGRLAAWLPSGLLKALNPSLEGTTPVETATLAMMAGIRADAPPRAIVEWESHKYRVDPARAEFLRLRRVRERQGSESLDEVLARVSPPTANHGSTKSEVRSRAERALAETLAKIVYAASLGDPRGAALDGGDVAARHVLGAGNVGWRIPIEQFGARVGWHVIGSLLGLDSALRRLSLRRMDSNEMPPEPTLSTNERQTAMLTAALLSPLAMTDVVRDEITAALARGRARVAALSGDRDELEKVVAAAGVGEWRREAIAWALANDPEHVASHFSMVELLWLGSPPRGVVPALDAWGAATQPLTGCLCLEMPPPVPWETLTGRPASGLLATRGADVALHVAEVLADFKLPASLAPSIVSLAMQDVIDRAEAHYFDDWIEFSNAVRQLSRDQLVDYIATLTADGPLVSADQTDGDRP